MVVAREPTLHPGYDTVDDSWADWATFDGCITIIAAFIIIIVASHCHDRHTLTTKDC
jgi:hypothetical protein